MGSKKDKKRRRRYSSSSDSSSSSGSSDSSHSSSSSSSSPDTQASIQAKLMNEAERQQIKKENMENVAKSMFMETKPEELIDQIFIILDDTEIRDICPTLIKHLSIPDLKERAMKCVLDLDERGLQAIYENQEIDPGAEEIDKALIQLGLVGKNIERDTNKWRTVEEVKEEVLSEEEQKPDISGENIDAIFDDIKEPEQPKEPPPPKRILLAEPTVSESADDAALWAALLMKDRQKLSSKLETSDYIASKLSDKPMDYVPEEVVIRRPGDEGYDSPRDSSSADRSPARSVDGVPIESSTLDDVPIGNPPLADVPIGNPPMAEPDTQTKPMSYRERAAALAAAEEDDDMIKADDIGSDSGSDSNGSDSDSSSSEEGEISDDSEDEGNKSKEKDDVCDKEIKQEMRSPEDESTMPQINDEAMVIPDREIKTEPDEDSSTQKYEPPSSPKQSHSDGNLSDGEVNDDDENEENDASNYAL